MRPPRTFLPMGSRARGGGTEGSWPRPRSPGGDPTAGFVRVEVEDRIAIVTIDRPPVNALNSDLIRELTRTFEGMGKRKDVGAVILTGAGEKAFVAGADIAEMAGKTGLEMRSFSELGGRLARAIERIPQPVIAAINGYALGGGCEIALACDLRIASERARFAQPEVNLGIPPGFGGTQRLPRLVGAGWASQMILTGEMVDAATAERIGLVNRVAPPGELLPQAKAIAPTLALAQHARELGVAVFFITGRPSRLLEATERNLREQGYEWTGLSLTPTGVSFKSRADFKTSERRKITEQGYTILLNLGDQESDLKGAYAERIFKLPNPVYVVK